MIETMDARVLLSREDLLTNAQLIELRASDPESERTRLVLARRFIAASFELTRALRAHTQCALVNHAGTAGTQSLEEAMEALFCRLSEYALRCREVAAEARKTLKAVPAPRRASDRTVGVAGAAR